MAIISCAIKGILGDGRASRPLRPGPARRGSVSISHGAAAQSRRGGSGARGAGAWLSRPWSMSLPRRRRRQTRGDPGGGGGSRSCLGCSVMKRVRTEQIQMAVSCYLKRRQYGDADGPLKQGLRLSQSTEEMANIRSKFKGKY